VKRAVTAVLALTIFCLGILVGRSNSVLMSSTYKTNQQTYLHVEGFGRVGVVSPQAPVLAPRVFSGKPKRGAWGCLPVRFGTEKEALRFLEQAASWNIREPTFRLTNDPSLEVLDSSTHGERVVN
jgi:hypothetical protein